MKDRIEPTKLIFYRLRSMDDLRTFLEGRAFQVTIVILIMINAITIGLETSEGIRNSIGHSLEGIDRYILIIFCIEIALKLVAYGWRFFLSAWNLFDFIIVGIALVPASGPLSILRTLRILRTMRLVKNIPKLKMIIESLIYSIPSIGWIVLLLLMIFYIFAVIGADLYGALFPEYFGSLGDAFFTLFQIMTLESWSSGIARPMMEKMPHSYIFFVPFILLATYTTLNVFIAVVVNTMNEVNRKAIQEEEEKLKEMLRNEHDEIMFQLKSLARKIDRMEEVMGTDKNQKDKP